MDNYTTGWAELDTTNAHHYGRGYPTAIIYARQAYDRASKLYAEATDSEDGDLIAEAWEVYMICNDHLNGIYERYNAGVLVEQVLETPF